jgi:hypothetical protein
LTTPRPIDETPSLSTLDISTRATRVQIEHGASIPRQFMQSKREPVPGNMDMYRKAQANFGKGQSKNIRNVILHSMPKWLVNKVIEEAKHGARDRLQKYIATNGLAAAQTYVIEQLKRAGVSEAQVLEKMGKAEVKGLDLEDLIMLKSDLVAIEGGEEHASTLFPSQVSEAKIVDLKDKLKAQITTIQAPAAAVRPQAAEAMSTTPDGIQYPLPGSGEASPPAGRGLQVRIGVKPFTWFVTDGVGEYLVSQSDGVYSCNCQPKCLDCAHVSATIGFVAHL